MLTLQDAINDPSNLRQYIDEQLVGMLVAELGYKWPTERVERVAQRTAQYFAHTRNMPWSIAEAVEEELLMYGDGSTDNLVGLLSEHI